MDRNKDTHRVYDEIAELYAAGVETKPYNAYLERPAIRALVPDIQGARVLDAGCGPGTNISWLIELGAQEVMGVDASARMVAIASREAPAEASLQVADLNRPLDFLADNSVDLVFSSLVVHYVADQERLFAEFARLLRPGAHSCFQRTTRRRISSITRAIISPRSSFMMSGIFLRVQRLPCHFTGGR